MNEMIRKIADVTEKLENVENINCTLALPYSHEGYVNASLVIHFKDDENGEERESQMYLFSETTKQWELYFPKPKKSEAEKLWEEFGEVSMNPETEEIESEWRGFPAGTHREDIWHWFEEEFNVSVADLMYK